MHLVADQADIGTLQLLLGSRLKARDINVKNKEGLTPLQVGLKRKNVDAEWRDLFIQFLRSIDQDITMSHRGTVPAGEPSSEWPAELPGPASGEGGLETDVTETVSLSSQTAVDSGSSDDEFADAVQVMESLEPDHDSYDSLVGC